MARQGEGNGSSTAGLRSDVRPSDDGVLAEVRLHDQMLSCLDFVIEKTEQLHGEFEVQLLRRSRDKLAAKREIALRSLGQNPF